MSTPRQMLDEAECGCGFKGCTAIEDGPACRYYDKAAGAKRDEAERLRAADAAVIAAAEACQERWDGQREAGVLLNALSKAVNARRAALAPARTVWRVTTERRTTVEAGDVCLCDDKRIWVHKEPSDPRFAGGEHDVVVGWSKEETPQ